MAERRSRGERDEEGGEGHGPTQETSTRTNLGNSAPKAFARTPKMVLATLLVALPSRPAFRHPSLVPEDVSFVDVSSGAPPPALPCHAFTPSQPPPAPRRIRGSPRPWLSFMCAAPVEQCVWYKTENARLKAELAQYKKQMEMHECCACPRFRRWLE